MNNKIFIACDTNKTSIAQKIIKYSNTKKLKFLKRKQFNLKCQKNGLII